MSFEIVKELKCINNKVKENEDNFSLTIGGIYESVCVNSTIDSKYFMVFDDKGNLCKCGRDNFEIISIKENKNTGWIIKCNDCCKEMSINELLKNNNFCPRCGQKFNLY